MTRENWRERFDVFARGLKTPVYVTVDMDVSYDTEDDPSFNILAYDCFLQDARKRKELVGINEEQWQAEQDPQTVDPGLRHDLMHALSLLPLHERSAVLLCCQNGLSHDEAARVLDIPLGTVKTNVLRGREKLKKTLSAWAEK